MNIYSQTVIQMQREGGVSVIPCTINGLNLNFIFDTGASDVSISLTEANFMFKNGLLKSEDIIDIAYYTDAIGNTSEAFVINLRKIQFAGLTLYNVRASIVKSLNAPLLLGQSALSKLGNFQLDLARNTLTVFSDLKGYDYGNNYRIEKENYKPVVIQKSENSDKCYSEASSLYLNGSYYKSIEVSNQCIRQQKGRVSPLIFGINAFAYNKIGDYVHAKESFDKYIQMVLPESIGPYDYFTYAMILSKFSEYQREAVINVNKAILLDTSEANKVSYLKAFGEIFRTKKNYIESAEWYSKVLDVKKNYSNLDLYNAGYDYFRAGKFGSSVAVFKKYTTKYPDDIFGYYMIAKANGGIDTTLTTGLAVNSYLKAIEIGEKATDKTKIKDQLVGAYTFMMQYSFNVKRDQVAAVAYADKALALDPTDQQSIKNKEFVSKNDLNVKVTAPKAAAATKPAVVTKPKQTAPKK